MFYKELSFFNLGIPNNFKDLKRKVERKKSKFIVIENKLMVTREERKRGRTRQGLGINRYKLLDINKLQGCNVQIGNTANIL